MVCWLFFNHEKHGRHER